MPGHAMSINRQTSEAASLQIGPTTEGMVRLYVEGAGIDLPMDFEPDEAEEIAEELLAAARQARSAGGKGAVRAPKGKSGERARARTGADGGGGRDRGQRAKPKKGSGGGGQGGAAHGRGPRKGGDGR